MNSKLLKIAKSFVKNNLTDNATRLAILKNKLKK